MPRWLALAVVCVLGCVVGCGDDLRPPYGVTDGSRLAARFWSAGDGALAFRTWFDRDLDTECTFDLATDGRFRCLPPSNPRAIIGYADPACTEPLLLAPMCGEAPRFARGPARTTATCGRSEATPIHDVLGARTSTAFYSKTPSGCIADGAPEGFAVYDLSAERAPTDFVGAELVATAPEARLSPYVFIADDGSQLADGIWDTERDAECRGDERCRPTEIALHYDFLYSDDTCTTHAALDLSDFRACHPASAVWAGSNVYFEIGAQVPPANVHRTQLALPGTCAPEEPPEPDDTFWLEGPVIPDESFATVATVYDGEGRVRAVHSLAVPKGFFDTSLDEPCEPRKFADGYRCQSYTGVTWWGTYSDRNCRVPAIVAYDVPPRVAYGGHDQVDSCDDVEFEGAYAVGAPLTQDTYYVQGETSCISRLRGTGELLFARGAAIDVPRLTR